MLRVIARIKQMGFPGLMAGASCCSLYDRCARLDEAPCTFPDLRFSCLSAYCVYDSVCLADRPLPSYGLWYSPIYSTGGFDFGLTKMNL